MINRFYVLLLVLIINVSACFAASLEDAQALYEQGDYSQAISIYEKEIHESGASASLLYNLGNCYTKAGDYGKALINYKRALLLDPSDKALKENISYISSKVEDNNKAEAKGKKVSISRDDQPFLKDIKNYISYSHLPDTWARWAGIAFVITCIFFAVYIFTKPVAIRKIGFFGGFIALGISVITLIFAFVSVSDRNHHQEGVVTAYKVNLRAEPDRNAKTNSVSLTRGSLLLVLDEEDSSKEKWYKVRLNNDFAGWVNDSEFEII